MRDTPKEEAVRPLLFGDDLGCRWNTENET